MRHHPTVHRALRDRVNRKQDAVQIRRRPVDRRALVHRLGHDRELLEVARAARRGERGHGIDLRRRRAGLRDLGVLAEVVGVLLVARDLVRRRGEGALLGRGEAAGRERGRQLVARALLDGVQDVVLGVCAGGGGGELAFGRLRGASDCVGNLGVIAGTADVLGVRWRVGGVGEGADGDGRVE